METNLKNQQTIQPEEDKKLAERQRASYTSPTLQVYGSVGKLTQGGGGSKGDGGVKDRAQ